MLTWGVPALASPLPHTLLELVAYGVAGRLYWRVADREPRPAPADRWFLFACVVFGAAVGSKLLHVFEHLPALRAQPDLMPWLAGKSVLGGFLGGTLGTELAKRQIGWTRATGDAWVLPLTVGLALGRVGCQLSGTWDQTYGNPTTLPWGWDHGDGVLRHPVALYESLTVIALYALLRHRWRAHPGARFAAFLFGYCLWRFGAEFLKPPYGPLAPGTLPSALYGELTALQWAALVGAAWYAALLRRRLAAPATA
jgi:prolipoprotein diacylglyceryltransferase